VLKERVRFAIVVVIGTCVLGCSETNSQLAPTPPVLSLTGLYSAVVIADMRSCQVSGTVLGRLEPTAMGYVGGGSLSQSGGHVSANWSVPLGTSQLALNGTLTKDGVLAFTLETFLFNPYQGGTKIVGSGTAAVQPDGRIVGTFQGEAVQTYSARVDTCRSDEHTIELRRRS
jgi:hypothetical protein